MIKLGCNYALCISKDNHIYAWGSNMYGQLGLGDIIDRYTPQIIPRLQVTDIACGNFHSVAIDIDGKLWTWGLNNTGALGTSDKDDRLSPHQINIPENCEADCIDCGQQFTLVKSKNGNLWACGDNGCGQLGIKSKKTKTYRLTKVILEETIDKIFCGPRYAYVISHNNTVYCWGDNTNCQLGIENRKIIAIPIVHRGVTNINPVQIVCGNNIVAFLNSNNDIYTMNKGILYKYNMSQYYNILLRGLYIGSNNVITIHEDGSVLISGKKIEINVDHIIYYASNYSFQVVVDIDGNLYSWGANIHGNLGLGRCVHVENATLVKDLQNMVKIINPIELRLKSARKL